MDPRTNDRMDPTLHSDMQSFPAHPPLGSPDQMREFYELAIGDRNRDYYLPRFERYDREGGFKLGWHWPSLFVGFWWALYRRIWSTALLYFAGPYILAAALGVSAAVMGKTGAGIASIIYLLALFLVPPLISNPLYHRHCRKVIERARKTSGNPRVQAAIVAQKGGTSSVALYIVLGLWLVATVGILAAVSIPAYQDYTTRARTVNAYSWGRSAASVVGDYFRQNHQIPASLSDLQIAALPPVVQSARIDPSNGVIEITLANDPVKGKTFRLVPSQGADGQVLWNCQAGDVKPSLLPAECRH